MADENYKKINLNSPEAQEMLKFLLQKPEPDDYKQFIKENKTKLYFWVPANTPPSQAFYNPKEDADKQTIAFKKRAADPATTADIVRELEAKILATQTPEGRKEICDAFNNNIKGYDCE